MDRASKMVDRSLAALKYLVYSTMVLNNVTNVDEIGKKVPSA
jgi:hypothetical protein